MLALVVGIVFLILGILFILGGRSGTDDDVAARFIGIIFVIIAVIAIGMDIFTIIGAQDVGVVTTFGSVDKVPMYSGIHFKNPVSDVIIFNAKTQQDTQTLDVVSAEGLNVKIDLTVQYHIDPTKAPEIYQELGEKYTDIVVDPEVRSATRDVVALYDAKSLYSSDRSNLTEKLAAEMEPAFKSHGIIFEKVLLRGVTLPASISQAIEAKQQMEQQIQQKQFEVQKEQSEAQRKVVEAQGIADANKIISNSITPAYIEWYTIEMLKDHHSDSMMFVPVGSNGLPMVSNIPLMGNVS